MTVKIAPVARLQFFASNGALLAGGKLYTYAAGTTTPLPTYTDSGGGTPNANPIVLNARGETPSGVWLTEGLLYKFELKSSSGATIWTEDNIDGVNDDSVTIDEWVASGVAPTYVSSTQFTLPGDQTTKFQLGRRLKTTITGGTGYHTITAAAYSSGITTVTVNGSLLDSGLSAVSYGILSATNGSLPLFGVGTSREITMPFQPAFLAYKSSESLNVTGNGGVYDIYYDTELFDRGDDFNTTTGVFTAPVTGLYALTATVTVRGMSTAATFATLSIRTSNRNYVADHGLNVAAGQPQVAMIIHALADMDAGDTAAPRIIVIGMAGDTADVYGTSASDLQTYFSGHLVA
jgi:hypothetical protein